MALADVPVARGHRDLRHDRQHDRHAPRLAQRAHGGAPELRRRAREEGARRAREHDRDEVGARRRARGRAEGGGHDAARHGHPSGAEAVSISTGGAAEQPLVWAAQPRRGAAHERRVLRPQPRGVRARLDGADRRVHVVGEMRGVVGEQQAARRPARRREAAADLLERPDECGRALGRGHAAWLLRCRWRRPDLHGARARCLLPRGLAPVALVSAHRSNCKPTSVVRAVVVVAGASPHDAELTRGHWTERFSSTSKASINPHFLFLFLTLPVTHTR